MFKYAFIANSGKQNPDNYSLQYKNDDFEFKMVAVSGMKMAEETTKKFEADGYELIDLCGDFDEEKAEKIKAAVGDKLDICYAKYSEEDLEKLDKLLSMQEYGIIVMGEGMPDSPVKLEFMNEEFNTYIAIVGTDELAKESAKKMVENGINFIELCSYFDKEKASEISEAIRGAVPIGYCG